MSEPISTIALARFHLSRSAGHSRPCAVRYGMGRWASPLERCDCEIRNAAILRDQRERLGSSSWSSQTARARAARRRHAQRRQLALRSTTGQVS